MLFSQEPDNRYPSLPRAWTQRTWRDWQPSYALMYAPMNLEAKILAHEEHGHRGPGSIGILVMP